MTIARGVLLSRSSPTGASAGVATRAVGRVRPSAAGGPARPRALGQGPGACAAGAVGALRPGGKISEYFRSRGHVVGRLVGSRGSVLLGISCVLRSFTWVHLWLA